MSGAPPTDRGVSDTVAFVLMFSVIILSVAAVSTTGIEQLTELRNQERIDSAERNMEATAAKLDKLHRQSDPFRSLVIPLNGGNVWVNTSSIEITDADTDPSGTFDSDVQGTYAVQSLEHRFSGNPTDTTIAYESGATFRTTDNSAGIPVRYEPAWRCDGDVAFVSFVELNDKDGINVAGGYNDDLVIGPNADLPGEAPIAEFNQGVRLSAELNRTATEQFQETYDAAESGTLEIDVSETGQPDEWDRYLATTGEWVEVGDYTYECTAQEAIVVSRTTIDLSA